jgi:hypothetical protein
MNVDAACFFMLSQDLSLLLGAIIWPDNREIKLRDFEDFRDWLHVISDLIRIKSVVVRIYPCEIDVEKELTNVKILESLKISFDITLIRNLNNLISSKNQMNVSTIGMARKSSIYQWC